MFYSGLLPDPRRLNPRPWAQIADDFDPQFNKAVEFTQSFVM